MVYQARIDEDLSKTVHHFDNRIGPGTRRRSARGAAPTCAEVERYIFTARRLTSCSDRVKTRSERSGLKHVSDCCPAKSNRFIQAVQRALADVFASPHRPDHAVIEADLAAGRLSFTALRHGFYAESCLQIIGDGLRTGELQTSDDRPVSWTARADLAEADAAILEGEGPWDGAWPALTATKAVTMAGLAPCARC